MTSSKSEMVFLYPPVMPLARSHRLLGLVLTALVCLGAGCVETERALSEAQTFDQGQRVEVQDPLRFTDQPYAFRRDADIADIAALKALIPADTFVWLGYASTYPYPVQGSCDPGRNSTVAQLPSLPLTIEGVVTLHPRYFQKISVCGNDERYQGAYILQDHSGGILVMRDARSAPFDFGDRVRLKVLGLTKFFDTMAIIAFQDEEVTTTPETREAIYYEAISTPFEASHVGKVVRIKGRVVTDAANFNFNEAKVEALDGSGRFWLVSFDRELGTRRVTPKMGEVVELTGPVVNSFGLRMIIASLGQMQRLESPASP